MNARSNHAIDSKLKSQRKVKGAVVELFSAREKYSTMASLISLTS